MWDLAAKSGKPGPFSVIDFGRRLKKSYLTPGCTFMGFAGWALSNSWLSYLEAGPVWIIPPVWKVSPGVEMTSPRTVFLKWASCSFSNFEPLSLWPFQGRVCRICPFIVFSCTPLNIGPWSSVFLVGKVSSRKIGDGVSMEGLPARSLDLESLKGSCWS